MFPVLVVMEEEGVKRVKRIGRPRTITIEAEEKARALLLEGLPGREVATRLSLSSSSVFLIRKKLGDLVSTHPNKFRHTAATWGMWTAIKNQALLLKENCVALFDIPESEDHASYADRMRVAFINGKTTGPFHWSIVVGGQRQVAVMRGPKRAKVATWTPTELRLCACGCETPTKISKDGTALEFAAGHKNLSVCGGCGGSFRKQNRKHKFCSRPCFYINRKQRSNKPCGWCGEIFHAARKGQSFCSNMCSQKAKSYLTKMTLEKNKSNPRWLAANGYKRQKCSFCRSFFWFKPRASRPTRYTCGNSECIGKRRGSLKRKIPLDRELLRDLFIVKRMTYAQINAHFGIKPSSPSSFRAVRAVGLRRQENTSTRGVVPWNRGKVAEMFISGISIPDIAKSFACSPAAVRTILKNSNITIRSGPKKSSRPQVGSAALLREGSDVDVHSSI